MRKSRERGTATIEAAITLPLLLFLMFAIVELGRAFVQYTVLANAVRNASRYLADSALNGTTGVVVVTPALQAATRNLVVHGNEAGAGAAILPGLAPAQVTVADAGGNNVRVSALYPYQPLLGATLPNLGVGPSVIDMTFNMNVAVTMRAL